MLSSCFSVVLARCMAHTHNFNLKATLCFGGVSAHTASYVCCSCLHMPIQAEQATCDSSSCTVPPAEMADTIKTLKDAGLCRRRLLQGAVPARV